MRRRGALLAALLIAGVGLAAGPAFTNLQRAARSGDAQAQFALAEAYRTGDGVTQSRDQAIAWYRRAAAQGDDRARSELGIQLFTRGDRKEAMPLLEAAAARGDPRALYIVATARFNGDYVTRDWPRAYAEMSRAAASGLPQAQASLAKMEPYLKPADKAQGEQILATLNATGAAPPAPLPGASAAPPAPQPVLAGRTDTPSSQPAPRVSPPVSVAPAPIARVAVPPARPPLTQRAAPAPIARTEIPPSRPAPPPAPAPRATGEWRIQLGAFSTRERAEQAWQKLAGRLPKLADHPHQITAAGAVWRLQASGFATHEAADGQCRAVSAEGGGCLTLNP